MSDPMVWVVYAVAILTVGIATIPFVVARNERYTLHWSKKLELNVTGVILVMLAASMVIIGARFM